MLQLSDVSLIVYLEVTLNSLISEYSDMFNTFNKFFNLLNAVNIEHFLVKIIRKSKH